MDMYSPYGIIFKSIEESPGWVAISCDNEAADEAMMMILRDLRDSYEPDSGPWENLQELRQLVRAGHSLERLKSYGYVPKGTGLAMDYETVLRVYIAIMEAKGYTPMERERASLEHHLQYMTEQFEEDVRRSRRRFRQKEGVRG